MKHFLTIVGLLAVGLVSCQQPQEAVLTPQGVDSAPVVKSVASPDTGLVPTPIDSGGVLLEDQYRYQGLFQINNITFDAGQQGLYRIVTARAFFSRQDSPIVRLGRTIGYLGMDLGVVTLNGTAMNRELYAIPLPRTSVVVAAGLQYVLKDLLPTYRSNTTYTWTVTRMGMSMDTVSIVSPEDINVISPAGGSIFSRSEDLELVWKGKGDVSIVISLVDVSSQENKALLSIQPGSGRNRIVLSSKVLLLLPPNKTYCFTFSLSNRREATLRAQVQAKALVQAASVYNSYVELR